MSAKKKKIGIITFTYGDNFGQRLQNYAVQEILKKYDSEVFTMPQIQVKEKFYVSCKKNLKRVIAGSYSNWKRRHDNFLKFDRQFISYYSKAISPENIPLGLTEEFDYFVAGSDQIWSPYSQDVNDTMFLTFAPFNKRIAFAPSIAAEVIPKEKRELYKKYFEGFEEISVREYQSAQLVYEIVGKKAKTLIDPTLMLDSDEWKKIEQKPIFNLPERYLLVYLLGKNEYSSQIEKIGHDNNMEIINILADKRYQSIGPSQFVYMIKKASVVMTDSYHGTIFSILYKIPFVVCTRKGTSVNMNSRFDTLFEKFMIEHRMIEEINKDNLWTVDFDAIYQKLDKERKKVNSYLNRYLNVEK